MGAAGKQAGSARIDNDTIDIAVAGPVRARGLCSFLPLLLQLSLEPSSSFFRSIPLLLILIKMSAPLTTASSAATKAPAPLTTPYIFRTECPNVYNLTSSVTAYQSFASLSEDFLFVDTARSQWQSCQPPGRNPVSQHFNETAHTAAVCPSGWTAWSLGLQNK